MIDLLAHIKGIFDKYKKDEVTVYAAQASFFIVIAFFPFIMLLLTVIQLVPGVQKSDLLSMNGFTRSSGMTMHGCSFRK